MHVSPERLADLLVERRWFGHKNRTIVSVEILDEGVIEDGPPALVLAMAKVRFDEGDEALYQLPLLVDNDIVRDAVDDPDRIARSFPLRGTGAGSSGTAARIVVGARRPGRADQHVDRVRRGSDPEDLSAAWDRA
jgi:hypothetical protein